MKFYIKHFSGTISEGGAVRNHAFYRHFSSYANVKIVNIASVHIFKRFINTFNFILYFSFKRNHHIYMHLGAIFVLFPTFLFRLGLGQIVFYFLDRLSKRHVLQIEVNDLPFEQNRDLELPNLPFIQSFQKRLFSFKRVGYDFASHSMRDYAVKMYNLRSDQCKVLLNGADKIKEFDESLYDVLLKRCPGKLRYVYVGSMNKGRQIEDLIHIFEQSNHILYLLGTGGDWIEQTLRLKGIDNIFYLGSFSDSVALQISSLCDVGVIPYDESRLYYNICYPTKVSFYLAAGLPILSTPLKETQYVLQNKDVAQFLPIACWNEFVSNTKIDDVDVLKQNVLRYRPQFYWDSILKDLNF